MEFEPPIFPTEGRVAVIATSTTAATTDLAGAGQLGTLVNSGLFFCIQADADVYAKLAFAAGTEVSGTATTGDGRGWLLEAKKPYYFKFQNRRVPTSAMNTFLSLQAVAATPSVRIAAVGRQHG